MSFKLKFNSCSLFFVLNDAYTGEVPPLMYYDHNVAIITSIVRNNDNPLFSSKFCSSFICYSFEIRIINNRILFIIRMDLLWRNVVIRYSRMINRKKYSCSLFVNQIIFAQLCHDVQKSFTQWFYWTWKFIPIDFMSSQCANN